MECGNTQNCLTCLSYCHQHCQLSQDNGKFGFYESKDEKKKIQFLNISSQWTLQIHQYSVDVQWIMCNEVVQNVLIHCNSTNLELELAIFLNTCAKYFSNWCTEIFSTLYTTCDVMNTSYATHFSKSSRVKEFI